jgi:NitT/TauT family transport system permease protein
MKRRWANWLREALPPVVLFCGVLVVWQFLVHWLETPVYLLPGPWRVAQAAWQNASEIARATGLTATAAAGGFLASLVTGVLIAVVFSQSRTIRRCGYPYAIFLQTVPIVAVAPLIITWFGYGFQSVVIVAGVIALFPVIANATAGMVEIDPSLTDLFRIHNAGRWQVLVKLRLPNSVPSILTGARTSSGLAVVGAIVGEFFVGAGSGNYGLGFLIRRELELLRTAELLATVLAATGLGVAIFLGVSLVGAAVMGRWYNPDAITR